MTDPVRRRFPLDIDTPPQGRLDQISVLAWHTARVQLSQSVKDSIDRAAKSPVKGRLVWESHQWMDYTPSQYSVWDQAWRRHVTP